jgi:hypothetical protein
VKELNNAPPSPASITSAYTASSSLQAPNILPPKGVPRKDPLFRLDGKRNEHILLKFLGVKIGNTYTRRCILF